MADESIVTVTLREEDLKAIVHAASLGLSGMYEKRKNEWHRDPDGFDEDRIIRGLRHMQSAARFGS